MFIGVRDIRFATGRFVLIGSVIALMTFMVVALSSLTGGLKAQSVSAVERLPGQTLVLRDGDGQTLARSDLDAATVGALTDRHGDGAWVLGVSTTRATVGDSSATVTVFGADPRLTPTPTVGGPPVEGGVLLGAAQAEALGARVGDTVTVGPLRLRLNGIGPTGDFAHTPVAYTTVDTWRALAPGQHASAVVLDGGGAGLPGTWELPMADAAQTVPGFTSENGSLVAMQALLLAISALVVGAFFTVWTVQRLRDLAVVRAMGASRGYLLRDGVGQALLVLLAGEAVGAALAVGLVAAAAPVVPVALTAATVGVPLVAVTVLGMLGALLAVRRVTTVDPLVALSR